MEEIEGKRVYGTLWMKKMEETEWRRVEGDLIGQVYYIRLLTF